MLPKKESSAVSLALVIALVAAAEPLAVSLAIHPVLAQPSSGSTAFPLPTTVPEDTLVRINGSSSMAVANQALKQRFETQYPGTQVEMAYSGTPIGLQDLLDGKVDLAAIGRPLTAEEKAKGLIALPLRREKIAIIVGPNNPFKGNLTFAQFAQMFRGEITNWSQVGGPSVPIRLIDRPDISDTRQAFRNYPVFKAAPFVTGATAERLTEDSTAAVIAKLGTDGISYSIANQVVQQPGVRIISMHNTLPNDPRYPYSQPLYYVYKGTPTPGAAAFLGLATAPTGQEALSAATTTAASAALLAAGSAATTAGFPAPAARPAPEAGVSPRAASPSLEASPGAIVSPGAAPSPNAIASPGAPSSPGAIASPDAVPSPTATASPDAVALPGGAANTVDRVADSGLPPWLWWLLLPLGLLGLLWWWRGRRADSVVPRAGTASPTIGGVAAPTDPLPGDPAATPTDAAIAATTEASNADSTRELPGGALASGAALTAATAALSGLLDDRDDAGAGSGVPPAAVPPADATPPVAAIQPPTDVHPGAAVEPPASESIGVVGEVVPLPEAPAPEVIPAAEPVADAVEESAAGAGLPAAAIVGAAALAAGAGAMMATPAETPVLSQTGSYIVLNPHTAQQVYAYWYTPEEHKQILRQQGGQHLALRLYDVTDLDLRYQSPYLYQEFDCEETATNQYLPVPAGDRNYLAEIGYLTADNRWLRLAQSTPVWIPAEAVPDSTIPGVALASTSAASGEPSLPETTEETLVPGMEMPGAAIAAAAGLGAVTRATWATVSGEEAQSDVEAAKFDVGQTDTDPSLADVDAGLTDLPGGYGESRIVLMPRDPQWAYAYWDIPNEHREAVRHQGGQRLALRLYDVTNIDLNSQSPHSLQQYDCEEIARDWHVPIPVSDRDYVAEIGYLTVDGNWLLLARSNSIRIPPIYPTDWHHDQFLTLAWDEDLRGKTFLEPMRDRGMETGNPIYDHIFGMAQSAEAMRVAGSLFGSMQQVPGSVQMIPGSGQMIPGSGQMIPGSGQMLAAQALSSHVFASGVGMWASGVPGFAAIPTLSGVGLTMSGIGMSGVGMGLTMSGIGMSGVGMGLTMSGIGMSGVGMGLTMSGVGMGLTMSGIGMSGVGFFASMPPIRARKFWLIADAELIVYGATEPDATVTIAGRPVQLNPDGTFRFQMSFQDGLIDFPILAIAADGEQTRAIHMKFNRETPYRHTNTKEDAIDEWLL